MRVDQDGITCDARNLGVGDRFGARRLSRDRKYCRKKNGGGSERTESAQGVSFQNRLS